VSSFLSNRSMGDVRSSADSEDDASDVEEPRSSPPLCRASNFPIIRMCSRRSNQASVRTSSQAASRNSDDSGVMTADGPLIERRAVRDRNGRILFYYAPLPLQSPVDSETVGCRVSLCKSRSAGEILSTSATVNNSRFAVPLQVRRRQLDDIRRRLAAVDVDDDGGSRRTDETGTGTCGGSRYNDRIICNRRRLMDNDDDDDDDDELDRHHKQRRQRLQQAVSILPSSADSGLSVRRGGSVDSDCGSRSDRDCSTDGSASVSTDTDHDYASVTVSLHLQQLHSHCTRLPSVSSIISIIVAFTGRGS